MDKANIIVAVVVAMLASPVLTKLLDLLAQKFGKTEKKKDKQLNRIETTIDGIKDDLADVKVDELRTNLLLLLHDYPDSADIPAEAEKYVVKYGGNSYLIPLICDWYDSRGLFKPEWLEKAKKEHIVN